MRFWDASAIVPLLLEESSRDTMQELLRQERTLHVWWGTAVECVSGIARFDRAGGEGSRVTAAMDRLSDMRHQWVEVLPTRAIRAAAERLVRVHPLRAGDALQLAAALVLADGQIGSVEFICLDIRLREAAEREGFAVLPENR